MADRHPRPARADAAQAADATAATRIRAAWIYYVEGHTQNEVAARLGLNRVAVTRLLSEARRRGEVTIDITSPLAATVALERRLEARFALGRAHVAPFDEAGGDPTRVIAAAAGPVIAGLMRPGLGVGVGWGRTLHATLPFIKGRPLDRVRVSGLLGGIAEARRFNPAEFAWRFAELFQSEGFLVPAPALVDSPATRDALRDRCGLARIFAMAEASDLAVVSAGGIATTTTSFRVGHLSESERLSLREAGAVGDILYHFVDAGGAAVGHPVNDRVLSVDLDRLARVPEKVLVSGGPEKVAILHAALARLAPTRLVTDERTARALAGDAASG